MTVKIEKAHCSSHHTTFALVSPNCISKLTLPPPSFQPMLSGKRIQKAVRSFSRCNGLVLAPERRIPRATARTITSDRILIYRSFCVALYSFPSPPSLTSPAASDIAALSIKPFRSPFVRSPALSSASNHACRPYHARRSSRNCLLSNSVGALSCGIREQNILWIWICIGFNRSCRDFMVWLLLCCCLILRRHLHRFLLAVVEALLLEMEEVLLVAIGREPCHERGRSLMFCTNF